MWEKLLNQFSLFNDFEHNNDFDFKDIQSNNDFDFKDIQSNNDFDFKDIQSNNDFDFDYNNEKKKMEIPSASTLQFLCKLSIKISKVIDFYYYSDSFRGKVKIVEDEGVRILYKNNEEHTSPIVRIYKVENEFLIVTENTICSFIFNFKNKNH